MDDTVYPETDFGFETFYYNALSLSKLIRQHHCAVIWDDYTEQRLYLKRFNESESKEAIESLATDGNPDFKCIEISDNKEQPLMPVINDSRFFADIENENGFWFPKRKDEQSVVEASEYFKKEYAPKIKNQIILEKSLLTGYQVAVKMALRDYASDILSQDELENFNDTILRKKGFALFGGSLLFNGITKQSAQHLKDSFEDVFAVRYGSVDDDLVSLQIAKDDDAIQKIPFSKEDYFNIGASSVQTSSNYSTQEMRESSSVDDLMYYLEILIRDPLNNLKAANGMPVNESLSYGFKQCFEQGAEHCISGVEHPMIATMKMGNELISNMVTLIIAKNALGLIYDNSENEDESGEAGGQKESKKTKTKNKLSGYISKAVGFIAKGVASFLYVLYLIGDLAYVVLSFLSPLFILLLVIGAIFAYMLPLMLYLYSIMMSATFIVSIFVGSIALPIFAIIKLVTIEDDYRNGLRTVYKEHLSPLMTPAFIGLASVMAWGMIILSMYILNMTFAVLDYSADQLTGDSMQGGIMYLISSVFLYVSYFIAIFVIFRYSIGLVKSLSDKFKVKMGLSTGDEDHLIGSMGFEQYIQAQITKTFATMPREMKNAVIRASMKDGGINSGRDDINRLEEMQREIKEKEAREREEELRKKSLSDNWKGNDAEEHVSPSSQENDSNSNENDSSHDSPEQPHKRDQEHYDGDLQKNTPRKNKSPTNRGDKNNQSTGHKADKHK
jgi:hypothetical protein